MADIIIAILLAIITLTTAYLGVHVTLHPADTPERKTYFKVGFGLCALLACALIGVQTYRSVQGQKAIASQMGRIERNTKTPPSVQVNVPPAQVIVQPNEKVKLEGSAVPTIVVQSQTLADGSRAKINIVMSARGTPIKDLYYLGSPALLDIDPGADASKGERALRQFFQGMIQKQKKSIKLDKLQGTRVDIGERTFQTVYSPPINASQINGILSGSTRLYVLVWASWKDENGIPGSLEVCRFMQNPPSKDIVAETVVWRACMQ